MAKEIRASVVLCDMNRTEEAAFGFRSWILQDFEEPYEIVLNLFNNRSSVFEALTSGRNQNCCCKIQSYDPPRFFNISAANNLGLARARGEYVLFANSDIIYPSDFLRALIQEMKRRDIGYMLAARIDLGERETLSLPSPIQISSFDFLVNQEKRKTWGMGSPWTARREVALSIGGFDAKVLCHEDNEFNDRIIHYLRRKGMQAFIYAASNLYGYHVYHKPSELYAASRISRAIIEPRRERLLNDPNSKDDIINTNFDDQEQLIRDMYSIKPPASERQLFRLIRGGLRRLRGSLKYLLRGVAA